MSDPPSCPVCGAGHAPADSRCQACGAQLDVLLVDLEPWSGAPEPVVEAPRRTREVLTVTGLLLLVAVGGSLLFADGDGAPGSKGVPSAGLSESVAVPEPTATPTPRPTPLPSPTPADREEAPDLTELAPLLGEPSGLSLAFRSGRQVHIVDLDTGVEELVELPSGSFDYGMYAVDGRIVTHSSNRLTVIEPDGSLVELPVEGGIDQLFVAPDRSDVWMTRFPRSDTGSPEVAVVSLDSLDEASPDWRALPNFAYPSTATSQGLIVALWQGRPFVFTPDGSVEQLPYDAVVAASGEFMLALTCVGGTEVTCPASLVDLGDRSDRPVELATTDPWAWALGRGGRFAHWVDWRKFPAEHRVLDLDTGEDVLIHSGSDISEEAMKFSDDGEWLAGAGPDHVLVHRMADGSQFTLPIAIDQFEGTRDLVLFSTERSG